MGRARVEARLKGEAASVFSSSFSGGFFSHGPICTGFHALFLLAVPLALAASPEDPTEAVGWYGKEYVTCGQQPSTVQITDCLLAAAERWDKRLNAPPIRK